MNDTHNTPYSLSLDELSLAFSSLPDNTQRYQLLVDLGEQLTPLPSHLKQNQYLVPGCQSRVWFVPQILNNTVYIQADSDAILVKGVIFILLLAFNNKSPQHILESQTQDLLSQLQLQNFLSPIRRNGLFSMIQYMKKFAATSLQSDTPNTHNS